MGVPSAIRVVLPSTRIQNRQESNRKKKKGESETNLVRVLFRQPPSGLLLLIKKGSKERKRNRNKKIAIVA